MRIWLKLSFCLCLSLSGLASADGHLDYFLRRYTEDELNARARKQLVAQALANPLPQAPARQEGLPRLELVDGEATRTHGFNFDGEVWVQVGQKVFRLHAASNAIVVYEDGRTATYADAQKDLRDWVRAFGPMRIQVHKFVGGSAFKQIRILPIKR